MQQQLGLIEVRPGTFSEKERAHSGGRGWLLGGARLTPWGTAVTWALLEFRKKQDQELEEAEADEAASGKGQQHFEFKDGVLLPASD